MPLASVFTVTTGIIALISAREDRMTTLKVEQPVAPVYRERRRMLARQVMVIDEHPIVREGIKTLINGHSDLQICGEAAGLSDSMAVFREADPDLVILEMALRDGSGLDLIRELVFLDSDVRILACSTHDEELYAERALRAGARGYVQKTAPPATLMSAIQETLNGRVYLSRNMTHRMIGRSLGRPTDGSSDSLVDALSDRELDVFEQIGHGVATRQIAEKLHLSPKTIETYRENIKAKLNLQNAAELTRYAVQWVLESAS